MKARDNQIIKENWPETIGRRAIETFPIVKRYNAFIRHIPVEIWEDKTPYIKDGTMWIYYETDDNRLRWIDDTPYLVTQNIKKEQL
jgi:hypothetical protein